MKNNFFSYLNYILKVDKKKPEIPQNVSYMTNRWLSMASKPIARIVNLTFNKWNVSDAHFYTKMCITVTPRYTKRIDYIKKPSIDTDEFDEKVENMAFLMELPIRDIENYNKTIEELQLAPK